MSAATPPADEAPAASSRPASSRRLLSNAVANYAGQLSSVVVGVALTPVIVRHLGTTGYGVWALVVSLQALAGLADFGVTGSVIRYVSAHHARSDTAAVSRVVSSLFALHLLLGLLAGIATSAFALWGLPLLQLHAATLHQARPALLVAGLGLVFALPLAVVGSVLIGLRRFEASNAVSVTQAIVMATATLVALESGGGATTLIAISAVGLALGQIARGVIAARGLPGLRITVGQAKWATIVEIRGYSSWLFILDVATRMFYNADAVVIAALLPVGAVTDYSLGFRAASAVSYLSGPAVSVLLPTAAALDATTATKALARLLAAATRLACAVTIPAALWLALWGHQAIRVWVGRGHGDAVPILWVFLGVFLVGAAQNSAATILRGIGKVRALAITVGIEYVANLGLSVWLVSKHGALGAAIGTLIPAAVVGVAVIPALVCRALDLPYISYALRPVLRPLIAAVPAAAILVLVRLELSAATLGVVVLSGALSVTLYAGFYWWLASGPEEQHLVREVLGRVVRAGGRNGDGDDSGAQHRDPDTQPSRLVGEDTDEPA